MAYPASVKSFAIGWAGAYSFFGRFGVGFKFRPFTALPSSARKASVPEGSGGVSGRGSGLSLLAAVAKCSGDAKGRVGFMTDE